MATLSVQSIRKHGMRTHMEQYMDDRDIARLCQPDTQVAHTTQYVVGDLLYVNHGH